MNDTHNFSRIERAIEALSRGDMIIVVDDFERENEGDLVAAAETAGPETINFMATHGRGLICQPITADRAKELDLPLMVSRQSDPHSTAFTVSVDHISSTTGISAHERARTVQAVVTAQSGPDDLVRPGHIFPLIAREGGVYTRKGHTEAAVDLARLAGRSPSGVICEIMNDDGTMARVPELEQFSQDYGLPMISVEELVDYRDAIGDVELQLKSESRLPTEYGNFSITVYTSADPALRELILLESAGRAEGRAEGRVEAESEEKTEGSGESNAEKTSFSAAAPLVRLHSECMTGEALGSLRCDCGPQLRTALSRIGREGGALLYLKQEGRGIGLAEKIRAYALQDQGADTVEANLALGHQADGRRFGAAAAVLKARGYRSVRLLTNNPRKEAALRNAGITIEQREKLIEGVGKENLHYLQTKAHKFGHILEGV